MDQIQLLTLLGFFAGSIPFSVLVGYIFTKTDIRLYGDGNPGGTNAWKAGGWYVGVLATLLDVSKGYLPVKLAYSQGVSGWLLVPIALAPILGHAFSPWLKFKGGKALAASGGAWLALIGPQAMLFYLLLTLPVLALQDEHALASNAGMLSLLAYTLFFVRSPSLVAFALLNICILVWKHRKDLFHPIQLRPWVTSWLNRSGA